MNNTITTDPMILDHTFEDDHQICCAFLYQGKQVSLWWTSVEIAGAFHYNDDRAREIVAAVTKHFDTLIANPDMDEEERYTSYGFMDLGW